MSTFKGRTFDIFRTTYGEDLWRQSVELQRKVYCDQEHYEKRPLRGDPDSFDRYDTDQSRRIVVMTEGNILATARVILCGKEELPVIKLRPELEEVTRGNQSLEVSSFCCAKRHRCILGLGTAEASRYITFLLLAGVVALARELQGELILMTIERSLYRYLVSLGFPLYRVGRSVAYHGLRQVCYGYLTDELIPGVRAKCRDEWLSVTNRAPVEQLLSDTSVLQAIRYAA